MVPPILGYSLPKDKPYLILGKGPTFERICNYNLDDYYIVCLNHTVELVECYIAHFIDSECISGKMIRNARLIVCPVFPHVNCKVKPVPAVSYFLKYREFGLTNLYCYNCSTWKKRPMDRYGEVIKAKFFSSEAVFRLLGILGIKKVFSLGIDGGSVYAKAFSHLKPLINGRKTFNDQFNELEKITSKFGMQWQKL